MSLINKILTNTYLDYQWLRDTLYNQHKDYVSHDFALSHTHSVIYKIVRSILPEPAKSIQYAEIGSHTGNSAMCAALASKHAYIHCFDFENAGWGGVYGTQEKLKNTMNNFAKDRSILVSGNSHSDAVKNCIKLKGPYDVFLVDGDHSEEGAMEDLKLAYQNLKKGGFLIFDDTIHHPYLNSVFDMFCEGVDYSESFKVNGLCEEEEKANYLVRGVAILKK